MSFGQSNGEKVSSAGQVRLLRVDLPGDTVARQAHDRDRVRRGGLRLGVGVGCWFFARLRFRGGLRLGVGFRGIESAARFKHRRGLCSGVLLLGTGNDGIPHGVARAHLNSEALFPQGKLRASVAPEFGVVLRGEGLGPVACEGGDVALSSEELVPCQWVENDGEPAVPQLVPRILGRRKGSRVSRSLSTVPSRRGLPDSEVRECEEQQSRYDRDVDRERLATVAGCGERRYLATSAIFLVIASLMVLPMSVPVIATTIATTTTMIPRYSTAV